MVSLPLKMLPETCEKYQQLHKAMTMKQYTITLTGNDIAVLITALGELPVKVAINTVNSLLTQRDQQDSLPEPVKPELDRDIELAENQYIEQ